MSTDPTVRYRIEWTDADADVGEDYGEGIDPDKVHAQRNVQTVEFEQMARTIATQLSGSENTLHGWVCVTRSVRDDELEPGILDWRDDYRWIYEDGGISDERALDE